MGLLKISIVQSDHILLWNRHYTFTKSSSESLPTHTEWSKNILTITSWCDNNYSFINTNFIMGKLQIVF